MPVERRAYERSTDPATTARADRPRCNGVGLSIADRQEPRASLSWKSGGLPPYSDADLGRRAARRPERGTVVNVVVWVVQVLLAVAFLGAGAVKVSQPRHRPSTTSARASGRRSASTPSCSPWPCWWPGPGSGPTPCDACRQAVRALQDLTAGVQEPVGAVAHGGAGPTGGVMTTAIQA